MKRTNDKIDKEEAEDSTPPNKTIKLEGVTSKALLALKGHPSYKMFTITEPKGAYVESNDLKADSPFGVTVSKCVDIYKFNVRIKDYLQNFGKNLKELQLLDVDVSSRYEDNQTKYFLKNITKGIKYTPNIEKLIISVPEREYSFYRVPQRNSSQDEVYYEEVYSTENSPEMKSYFNCVVNFYNAIASNLQKIKILELNGIEAGFTILPKIVNALNKMTSLEEYKFGFDDVFFTTEQVKMLIENNKNLTSLDLNYGNSNYPLPVGMLEVLKHTKLKKLHIEHFFKIQELIELITNNKDLQSVSVTFGMDKNSKYSCYYSDKIWKELYTTLKYALNHNPITELNIDIHGKCEDRPGYMQRASFTNCPFEEWLASERGTAINILNYKKLADIDKSGAKGIIEKILTFDYYSANESLLTNDEIKDIAYKCSPYYLNNMFNSYNESIALPEVQKKQFFKFIEYLKGSDFFFLSRAICKTIENNPGLGYLGKNSLTIIANMVKELEINEEIKKPVIADFYYDCEVIDVRQIVGDIDLGEN